MGTLKIRKKKQWLRQLSVRESSSRTRSSDGNNALLMLFTQVRPTSPRMISRRSLLRFTAPPPTSFSHSATSPHSEEADQLALHASTITWTRRRSLNQSTDSSELVCMNDQTDLVSRRRRNDDDSRSFEA